MISVFTRKYGETPLHLIATLATFAVAVYAFAQIVDVRSTDNLSLAIWFVAGALLHDLLFLPIYAILDIVARLGVADHALRPIRVVNHIRFPVVISATLFFVFFPLILQKSEANFERTAGAQAPDYLSRWLLVTAIVFGVSAIAYAVRLRRGASASEPAPAAA